MGLDILSIEKSLLQGKWIAAPENDDRPVLQLADAVIGGRLRDVLISDTAKSLFHAQVIEDNQTLDQAFGLSPSSFTMKDGEEEELSRLIIAIACLHAFVQANWTGPDLDVQPLEAVSSGPSVTQEDLDKKSISELARGGEPAYHLAKYPSYLKLAQIVLALPYTRIRSAAWWTLRTYFVHQQVLDEPVPLPDGLFASLETLASAYATEPELAAELKLEQGLLEHQLSQDKAAAELFVQAAKATGLQYALTGALGKRTKFQQNELSQLVVLAESHLPDEEAKNAGDKNHTANTQASQNSEENVLKANVPESLALNDEVVLEQTEFTSTNPVGSGSTFSHIDPSNQPSLHPLDQCILLALCLNVKNTSPTHGLTGEQMAPYVARVISHPRNWSIHTMALLLRSRLESSRTRTAERAVLQLQALIDQMPSSDSTVKERLQYYHTLLLPSKWELERELAQRFLGLGVVKSALEIFERLEMWEEVIKCWAALERPEKGIAIVRDLLEGRKAEAEVVLARGKTSSADRRQVRDKTREAKLWCLLGDLEPENAEEHYQRAWTVSEHTSGRAMRSLGGYYFARGQYSQAIDSLKRAVGINPLLSRSWFILGCACMRVEDWEEAKNAFMRCVAIDDEDGESWNNLASMYLRLGTEGKKIGQAGSAGGDKDNEDQAAKNSDKVGKDATTGSIPFSNKLLAFRALKQGLRSSYDNWRMWYNYMIVSIDVGELFEACRALGRVVEETSAKMGADSVDVEVLERLVSAATKADDDETESQAQAGATEGLAVQQQQQRLSGLHRTVLGLLERTILPRVSDSPRIFRAYARLLTREARWGDALHAHLDAYRCGAASTLERGAETDVGRWREAVGEVEEVVDVLRNFGPRVEGSNWRLQARSIVRSFVGRARDYEDEPEWGRLVELQDELRKE